MRKRRVLLRINWGRIMSFKVLISTVILSTIQRQFSESLHSVSSNTARDGMLILEVIRARHRRVVSTRADLQGAAQAFGTASPLQPYLTAPRWWARN